jgi:hypothetical protein
MCQPAGVVITFGVILVEAREREIRRHKGMHCYHERVDYEDEDAFLVCHGPS